MVTRIAETAPPPYYTAEMARSPLEDGNRYEVVYGVMLVTPAPRYRHQEPGLCAWRSVCGPT